MKETMRAQCSTGQGIDNFGHASCWQNTQESASVHTALLGLAWRVIESYQINPAELIDESLYRPGEAGARRRQITGEEYYAVVARGLRVIDDEGVGIRAASLIHPSHLDLFGYAWMAAPNLSAGFQMTQSCIRSLKSDLQVRLLVERDRIGLVYERRSDSMFASVDADCEIGGLVRFCRFQFGDSFAPLSVSFRRPEPANRRLWDDYFGVRVQFAAPSDMVFVSRGYSEQCLPTAHMDIFTRNRDLLLQKMAAQGRLDLVQRVKAEIQRQLPSGDVALDDIAEVLHTPVRTLHRKLSHDGTTFRQLLRDVRIDLARRYIRDESQNITDIAYMLGYCDSAAFARAFKGWFGDAPTVYRSKFFEISGRRDFA